MESNPCLILTRNNLELTKRCIESVRAQDVPVSIQVYDNESTDGTGEWLSSQEDVIDQSSGVDLGVSAAWNFCLDILFSTTNDGGGCWHSDHVLVINNDTVIPPFFYRELLSHEVPFVTGTATDQMEGLVMPERKSLTYGPDFSAFLIRRECWEEVGPFEEQMVLYCQDCDYDIRALRLGIPLWKSNMPFYHVNSQTLKRAAPADAAEIQARANDDREVFRQKYGCLPGTREYGELFK